jgi:L-ascorbate metabolism protein UlaG (beta-lactamase superfamily)
MRAVIRWGIVDRLRGERRPSQPGPGAPRVEPDLELIHETPESPRLTWIGHASFLGGLAGARFLVDPVLSERVGWLYRRHVAPGLAPEELPAVDALLVSHNHYDHLDLEAVRHLPRSTPVFVPEGLGRWFVRRGFTAVTELRWWQSAECGPLRITLVPARHWSRRGLFDTNRSLWGGFVVEGGGAALYHAGDTGDFPGFREIRERFPSLTAAMLPIGAYRPGWFMEPNHLNPEQAARAFLELGAHHLVPMHWGTFQLTDEPLREPAARLRAWWREHRPEGRELHLMAVGETVVFEAEMMEHVARRFGGAAPGERVTVL